MIYDLEDKVALVTGAGRRGSIGAAVARRLAQDGAHVIISDICAPPSDLPHAGCGAWEELVALAQEVESLGVQAKPLRLDVTEPHSIKAAVAQVKDTYGRLDILGRPSISLPQEGDGVSCPLPEGESCNPF